MVLVLTFVAGGLPPPKPRLEVVELVVGTLELLELVMLTPSAGAGGGRAAPGALGLPYNVNKTLGASAALFAEGRLPPQYSVLLPGQGLLQLARFWTALVPASRVLAQ